MDCIKIRSAYHEAARNAEKEKRDKDFRVYVAISAVCSFMLRTDNWHEPYVPMMIIGGQRSAIPEDFRGEPIDALYENLDRFKNPALRARVADVVWLLNPNYAKAGYEALKAYAQAAQILCLDNGEEEGDFSPFLGAEYLGRAIEIARRIGWDKDESIAIRELLKKVRTNAANEHIPNLFKRLADFDINYGVSSPGEVAEQAKKIISNESDANVRHMLWHVAAQDYARNQRDNERSQCIIAAAECSVEIADQSTDSALVKAHHIERALVELHKTKGTKEQRVELRGRLKEIQASIPDEMQHFFVKSDISDIVKGIRTKAKGKKMMEILRALVLISSSPNPEKLQESAKKTISRFPLSHMFSSVHYANKMPVARVAGASSTDDPGADAIRQAICQEESLRRGLAVSSSIYPLLEIISTEHHIGKAEIVFLCQRSLIIPHERVAIYAEGFMRFFRGDMLSAVHILVPQMENSFRYALEQCGVDLSTIKTSDMTQGVKSLSQIFEKFRNDMENAFGPALVMDIDNVFHHRIGLHLRDRLFHGLVNDEELILGSQVCYACWLIFHICFLPLLHHWDELVPHVEAIRGENHPKKCCE